MNLHDFKEIFWWLAQLVAMVLVINWLLNMTPLGRDDTDTGRWGDGRSGVKPITDAKTGCQYLVTSDGGITPRLGKDGKQICIGGDQA